MSRHAGRVAASLGLWMALGSGGALGQRLERMHTLPRNAGTILGEVTDVDVLPDGRVVVLDNLSHTVLLFDTTGAFIRSMGREGAGPGEIRGAAELEVGPRGEIVVLDYANRRITLWRPDGTVLRDTPLRELLGRADVWPHELVWERSAAWLKTSRFLPGAPIVILRLAPDLRAVADTAALFVEHAEGAATCVFCAFTAAADGRIVGVAGDSMYRAAVLERDGTAAAAWSRAGLPAVRRSDAELAELGRAGRRMAATEGGTPAEFSLFRPRFPPKTIGFDHIGRFWALPAVPVDQPALFDVFGAPGSEPATIRVSERVTRFRVREGWLVAGGLSDLDEPVVHVYRIRG